ncbi:hypothetical protein ACSBR2_009898 [Camellia fascicularis]
MDGEEGGGSLDDLSSTTTTTTTTTTDLIFKIRLGSLYFRTGPERYQHLLDKSTLHVLYRWIAFAAIVTIYIIRVYLVQGFYIVSYGLGIYILNLLIRFISPKTDPAFQDPVDDGLTLPTRGSDEFRLFVRCLP